MWGGGSLRMDRRMREPLTDTASAGEAGLLCYETEGHDVKWLLYFRKTDEKVKNDGAVRNHLSHVLADHHNYVCVCAEVFMYRDGWRFLGVENGDCRVGGQLALTLDDRGVEDEDKWQETPQWQVVVGYPDEYRVIYQSDLNAPASKNSPVPNEMEQTGMWRMRDFDSRSPPALTRVAYEPHAFSLVAHSNPKYDPADPPAPPLETTYTPRIRDHLPAHVVVSTTPLIGNILTRNPEGLEGALAEANAFIEQKKNQAESKTDSKTPKTKKKANQKKGAKKAKKTKKTKKKSKK